MTPVQQVRNIRQLFVMLLRSKQLETEKTILTELSETDLIDCLKITEGVVVSRLRHSHDVWRADEKRHYSFLFNSIKTEAAEAIRNFFTSDGNSPKGVTVNKYNTLVLDAVFALLQHAGPQRASSVVTKLCQTLIRDMHTVKQTHIDDALVAQAIIMRLSKERAQGVTKLKTKRLSSRLRLSIIEKAARSLQAA